jgi:hypothetical protein
LSKEKRKKYLICSEKRTQVDIFPKETILNCLATGALDLHGQFVLGSNYTLLVTVTDPHGLKAEEDADPFIAVYKPEKGERPLWDFPYGSLEKREVAAYIVSEALDWDLVPPSVYRQDGPFGPGSLQVFIDHDPEYHYFNFSPQDIARLRPVVAFDLIINNADRKGGHILKDPKGHLWLIDHGLCFHELNKLRTVLWDFAGEAIPPGLVADIERFSDALESDEELSSNLITLLSEKEITAMRRRVSRILRTRKFPLPDERQRQYPWPPV